MLQSNNIARNSHETSTRRSSEKVTASTRQTVTTRLLTQLKRLLRASGLRYADVAVLIGVSEKTVKRYMVGQSISVAILEKLCEVAGITLFELVELATSEERADP